jgi:hypothetical protein
MATNQYLLRRKSKREVTETKSEVPDWGIKSTLAYRVEVDSGIGLPIKNVLQSTLESGHKVRL